MGMNMLSKVSCLLTCFICLSVYWFYLLSLSVSCSLCLLHCLKMNMLSKISLPTCFVCLCLFFSVCISLFIEHLWGDISISVYLWGDILHGCYINVRLHYIVCLLLSLSVCLFVSSSGSLSLLHCLCPSHLLMLCLLFVVRGLRRHWTCFRRSSFPT